MSCTKTHSQLFDSESFTAVSFSHGPRAEWFNGMGHGGKKHPGEACLSSVLPEKDGVRAFS